MILFAEVLFVTIISASRLSRSFEKGHWGFYRSNVWTALRSVRKSDGESYHGEKRLGLSFPRQAISSSNESFPLPPVTTSLEGSSGAFDGRAKRRRTLRTEGTETTLPSIKQLQTNSSHLWSIQQQLLLEMKQPRQRPHSSYQRGSDRKRGAARGFSQLQTVGRPTKPGIHLQ
ncbi:hypothetical protein BSL78_23613 [Apostichopus japonicus]|uniref:Uncharacterized protein n=1 Tax=Stichopus japonicus TaxID=307972 RepID=A0A2G8JUW9_STIJA|nr:hypothetical protein BSL78_23613 [Apostichopus japonicus]